MMAESSPALSHVTISLGNCSKVASLVPVPRLPRLQQEEAGNPRQQQKAIGRMFQSSPSQGGRFYLRLLQDGEG